MPVKNVSRLMGLLLLTSSLGNAAELRMRVGETKVVSTVKAQGAALDNPKIAEIQILKDARLQVAAKANGRGTLSVFTADGKTQTYGVQVVGGSEAKVGGPAETPGTVGWPTAIFGGKKIADARCAEPLDDESAGEALDDARDLLRQGEIEEAIQKLERALHLEPDAAVVHLFLGSAWAKLKDQARGAYNYETFALSCPEDPKTRAIVRLLREFDRRVPRSKSGP